MRTSSALPTLLAAVAGGLLLVGFAGVACADEATFAADVTFAAEKLPGSAVTSDKRPAPQGPAKFARKKPDEVRLRCSLRRR